MSRKGIKYSESTVAPFSYYLNLQFKNDILCF